MQDELLAMDDDWTLRDHLNTVRKVVDAKGKVISSLEYNAFGVLVNATGDKPLFRYTGKMFDDATGLQWNVNRWYDANVGRWISEDPIGFEAKDANLIKYVSNSPLSYLDYDGKKRLVFIFEGFGGYGISGWIRLSDNPMESFADIAGEDSDNAVSYASQVSLPLFDDMVTIAAKRPFIKNEECRYHTIVIAGFSMGGDRAIELASHFRANNIKVHLVYTLDPVAKWTIDTTPATIGAYWFNASTNVQTWKNYYQRSDTNSLSPNLWPLYWAIWGDHVAMANNTRLFQGQSFDGAHMAVPYNQRNAFLADLAGIPVDRSHFNSFD